MPDLLYEKSDHVGVITLNRPERMNAISVAMLESLSAALDDADRDGEVRAIIITGAGRGFCSGLDIKDAMAGKGIGGSGALAPGGGAAHFGTRALPTVILHEIDTPVLCAINGPAAGYGLDLALGCDMRLIADTARLLPGFAKRGIVPESGGTWLLPRLLGWSKAAELIFTGRTLLAPESLALGLVSEVVPDGEVLARALAVAKEIAANAPLAVQSSKRLMRMGMEETFNDHVHHVYLQFLQLIRTGDFKEGMTSFLEKRPADFKGH
jgi:enoyl-CoA hydratase/carnithine racemase